MRRQHNQDESWAEKWLMIQGYQEIRRPHSDPPDFLVDGRFAVEVTRMSQRVVIEDDRTSRSEEEVRQPLTDCLERALNELGPPGNEGRSWTVDCTYDWTTPLPHPKAVSAQVTKALRPLLMPYGDEVVFDMHSRHRDYRKHAGEPYSLGWPHVCLECGICLDLMEFSHTPSKFFLQNVSDGKGFHVAGALQESIRNRIQDKSEKIRNHGLTDKYHNWWLLLVDYVYHAPVQKLSERELSFIREQDFDFWSRVAVLSRRNLSWHYDLILIGRER